MGTEVQELKMKLWFSENEIYSDGSNITEWLKNLKEKLEDIFVITLTEQS